jgi:hypothetical protein
MKFREQDIESDAWQAVLQCLADVPFCSLKGVRRNVRIKEAEFDFVAKLRIEGEPERDLIIEVKSNGQPRILRDAANTLYRKKNLFKNPYCIIVAPYISEAAAEILAADGIGYVDFAGNCRICVGKIYIRCDGKSNRFTEKRDLRSLYSPKGERVLRILLAESRRSWLLQQLADTANVSIGQVSNVKKLLDSREWLSADNKGFKLAQPEALLREWAASYNFSRNRTAEFYAMTSLDEIERAVAGENEGVPLGALTAFSAAARFAPAVRYQKVSAYVRQTSESVAQQLGWKRVTSGGNVSLIEPYDEGVFSPKRMVNGIQLVSPVQAYLDLQGNPSRGAEAAEALLQEAIKPSW